jgi:LEA14-like dessication related protein
MLGSLRRLAVVFLILVIVSGVLSGCLGSGSVKEKIEKKIEVSKPQIISVSHRWGEITPSTSEIITEIVVSNPNPIPIPIKNISVHIYMNGIDMGEGKNIGPASLAAKSNTTIIISTKLNNAKIPEWWVSHLKNGEVSKISLKGTITFDLKIFDFNWPFEQSSEIRTNLVDSFVMDDVPLEFDLKLMTVTFYVSMRSHWGKVTSDSTEIIHNVEITNPTLVPLPITNIGYEIFMNDIKVGEGVIEESKIIAPKSSDKLEFVTLIDNNALDDWWVSHLQNGEETTVEMKLYLILNIKGVGEIKVQIPKGTIKTEIKTNILGS